MLDEEEKVLPWYRHRWPWYIIGLLSLGVFGTGILVISAIDNQDPVVVDDYYKEGLAINRTLDRQRAAQAMDLIAHAQYDAADGILSVRLTGKQAITVPLLNLSFIHATLAHRDYKVVLVRQSSDVYRAQLKTLRPGNWDMKLEPQDQAWRLSAHLSLPATSWQLKPEHKFPDNNRFF